VLAGNGASELIYLVAALFREQSGHVVTPAFTEYEDACEAYGISLKYSVPELTFVGNPSSPEGRLRPRSEIRALLGVRIVDEAFIDFAGGRESLLAEAVKDPRIIVLRSLTKFYALPGLRIGFAVAVPETIRRLRALQPPWSVNAIAQQAGIAAIADRAYTERTLRELPKAREALRVGLSDRGFEPMPSETNYVLCRVPDAAALGRALRERGIVVRNCDSFTGLEPNHFIRVAVRSSEDNGRLLQALSEIGVHA
jgi:threonine-phosphate decarboxylase